MGKHRIGVKKTGTGKTAAVKEDAAVRLIGDHPDGTAVTPASPSQPAGQTLQGGRWVDPPRGVVRGVDDDGAGPRGQCRDDGVDVKVESGRLQPHPNRRGAAGDDHSFVEEPRWAQEDHLITGVDHAGQGQCDRPTGAASEEHVLGGEAHAQLGAQ